MRFVVQEESGRWSWSLWWRDTVQARSPETYGSKAAAEASALAFRREVERAERGMVRA